jgi:hypothetical protein
LFRHIALAIFNKKIPLEHSRGIFLVKIVRQNPFFCLVFLEYLLRYFFRQSGKLGNDAKRRNTNNLLVNLALNGQLLAFFVI